MSDHYLNKALDLIDQLEEPNAQNLFRKLIKECDLEILKIEKVESALTTC